MRLTCQRYLSAGLVVLAGLLVSASALAQAGGGGAPGGPGGGPGGRFDPAQFRQMMMDRLRDRLKASDEEWAVLQPKLEKVMQAQQNSMGGGGMGMFFGRGGPGGPGGGNDNPSPMAKAARDLQAAVGDDANVDKAELAKRMAAYREAREAARKELADAQKALLDVLTPQQEAVLLAAGMVQ